MAIKFKELRKYISRVCRLSICFEDGHYDNYRLISDIPDGKYDDLYVYGIGMVDVEFPLDVYKPFDDTEPFNCRECFLGCAMEIVLHEEDRGFERDDEEILRFSHLRKYLQIGKFFTVVKKGEWKPDYYEWRDDISSEYDQMKVYGIDLEDNPSEMKEMARYNILDTFALKSMVIVLEDSK